MMMVMTWLCLNSRIKMILVVFKQIFLCLVVFEQLFC